MNNDGFSNSVNGMPKSTKIVVGILSIVFLVIIIVAIIAVNNRENSNTALVEVSDFVEDTGVPKGYREVIEQSIGRLLNEGLGNTNGLVFSNAVIRDGSYEENDDGKVVSARFIVDVEDLGYSFEVKVVWPKSIGDKKPVDPDIEIRCPHYRDVIYKDKQCIAQPPEQQIKRYLPHYEYADGIKYAVSMKKYNGSPYLQVEIPACGREEVKANAATSVKDWIKSIYLDPNDFVISVFDTCGG